ncbi:MAG: hypothetical protein SWC40_05330 [Thermodesulfobacteriota bacterium]|nr:hypothetical protein [Thermodesulfobacteriota bacterium]
MIPDRLKTLFDAEHALRCRDLDFTGAWMTVQTLRRALAEHPQAARIETVYQARVLPHMRQAKVVARKSSALGARASRPQRTPWA